MNDVLYYIAFSLVRAQSVSHRRCCDILAVPICGRSNALPVLFRLAPVTPGLWEHE